MGRRSTGALTVNEVTRFSIKELIQSKALVKERHTSSTVNWSNGNSLTLIANEPENYIKLQYEYNSQKIETKILLDRVPSNLGKGHILYFLCPQSHIRCKTLYLAYGSSIFKARDSYTNTLYYPSQTDSKLNSANNKYWRLHRELEREQPRKIRKFYNGKVTRSYVQRQIKETKRNHFDNLRWSYDYLPACIKKTWGLHEGNKELMMMIP